MSKNSLYNLIEKIIILEPQLPLGVIDLRGLTDTKGKKYFKAELATDPDLIIGQYTLESHHISVYESAATKLDLNSQYHYTAYLRDEDHNQYRLHLYYNVQDNCVSRPILSLCEPNNKFTRVDCGEDEDAFYSLAEIYTKDSVQYFRKRQAETISTLEADYAKLELQLTKYTSGLPKNKDLCLDLLQQQIAIQEKILSYSNFTALPLKKIRYLGQFKQSVMNTTYAEQIETVEEKTPPKSQKAKKSVNRKNTKPLPEKTEKKQVSGQTFFAKSTNSKPATKQVSHSHLPELTAGFTKRLTKAEENQEINENTIAALESLYGEYINKQWMHEFEGNYAEPNEIKEFMALRGKIEQCGVAVLQRLLILGKYDLARQFNLFFSIVPLSILPYALQQNKPDLLALILQKKLIDTHYKQIDVLNVHYHSMAEYCFANTNEKQSCLKLLDVYVKADGSLMGIDKATGLPFAALLLMDHMHPLYQVLADNPDLTINNRQFYIQLNHVLKLLVSKKSLPEKLADKVNVLIDDNNKKIELINRSGSKISLRLIDHVDSFNQKEEQTVGEEYVAKLLLDPEFKSIKEELDAVYVRLMKKMPPVARRQFPSSNALLNYDEIKDELDEIEDFDEVPLFEEFKQGIIKKLVLTAESAKLRIELFDVQNKIQSTGQYRAKLSKTAKALLKRQEQIISRIKEIQEEFEMSSLVGNSKPIQSEFSRLFEILFPNQKDMGMGIAVLLGLLDGLADGKHTMDNTSSSDEEDEPDSNDHIASSSANMT